MKLLRTGISNFIYWATWGGRSKSGVHARLPELFQCLSASLSCKAQSPGKSISALTQDFLKGRRQASFFSRLLKTL